MSDTIMKISALGNKEILELKNFHNDFHFYISNVFQSHDHVKCLIQALKVDDKETFKALSKFSNIALPKDKFSYLRITNGGLTKDGAQELQKLIYINYFTLLEVTLQHYKGAWNRIKNGDKINESSFEEAIENSFSNLIIFYEELQETVSFPQEIIDRLKLHLDIRNCLMHNRGTITKRRKILKELFPNERKLGELHYTPDKIENLVQSFLTFWSKYCGCTG